VQDGLKKRLTAESGCGSIFSHDAGWTREGRRKMSKPLSKKQIDNMMMNALTVNSRSPMAVVDNDTLHDECRLLSCHVGALVREIQRLQKLAKATKDKKSLSESKRYAKRVWDAQDRSEAVNDKCPRNAKGCRCAVAEVACKAFDYYDGRLG
jgi:hypothetical protein